jgi:prepilin-type N-terminal cleavage/methylation domain-containing protein
MELPSILISDKNNNKGFTSLEIARPVGPSGAQARARFLTGFTLVELLIVIALFAMILSLGLVIGFDSYRRDTLIGERNTLISAMQKARSQAINNIGDKSHGFYFDGSNYVVFKGNSYATRDASEDLVIPKNPSIIISGMAEVVFGQLTGDASPASYNIVLTDGVSSSTISVNGEGRINW